MKKIYTLLIALLALNVTAFAADWNIVLNVTAGADRVKAVIGSSETSSNIIQLSTGENPLTIPEYESLYIIPNNADDIVVFKDKNNDVIEKSYYGYYEIYASEYRDNNTPYTLSVMDESSYRTKNVTVNMDDCSKVTIVRADGKEFKPESNNISIAYNPDDESKLTIKPRSLSDLIYKVTVGGTDIEKSSGRFYVNLVDKTGAEATYVETVDVTANYPEGLKFKTTITLDGPKEMISYIKINNTNVTNLDACLTADGFEANPGETIAIGFDSNHKIEEVTDNGETKYAYSQLTIEQIDRDHNVTIKGHKYATYKVKFNITGAEGVVGSFGSTKLTFTENENLVDVSEKNNYITFSEASGWYFESFNDANDKDYLSLSDYTYYKKVYLSANEGDEYTIVAKKIRRDNQVVIYYDDFSELKFDYFETKFQNYELPDAIVTGYNVINFRDEDGYITAYASAYGTNDYGKYIVYKNDELFPTTGKYFEDENVAHKDVYKVFFVNEPTVHNVTFNVTENALDGYSVTKDLIADVDYSAAVKAVGKTRFTIAPIARADNDITVTVGGKTIEPVDGVYTFETEADTNVKVSTSTTDGIDDILTDGAKGKADVYNLQGIRIRRDATAADINSLPAGIYIVNGVKIAVK